MKYFLLFLFSIQYLFAKTYFQQQVNYKIDVKLNDSTHTLHAHETIEYTNHSEDALEFIYFHLWPNAYQKNSALDKQLMADGDTKLHFAKQIDKGFVDSLNFTSNSQKLRWDYDAKHHDICKIFLPKPLLPNETIEISTPFFVKIPSAKLSRLGRIGQFYAVTQWYPKPAVYDADGWHQMPYLNQGEFYSEFGSFDVSITLPQNYVVGATGNLQTQSEIDFLNERCEDTTKKKAAKIPAQLNAFPASSKKYKTIRYTQNDVHDFAWFADKRFIVKKSEVKLPHSGNTVTTWAMFTPSNAKSWEKVTHYINDAIYYYSKWNGDYPYKHCTAIDGTISAGGGMEYPNITIINSTNDSLQMDIVIAHEVGHNWFYGILGSNERLHPWMDEGINSFNEMRYVKTKYPNINLPRMLSDSKTSQNIIGLKKLPGSYFNFYSYWITAKYNADQPIELPSEEFTSMNYGQIVYQKTAASFNLLYSYLGAQLFDSCMHNYFNKWKFKHPQPADIRAVFENTTGKNLAWFFDDVIGTKEKVMVKNAHSKFDETGKQFSLKLKNNGQISAPIELTLINKDSTRNIWIEPFKNDTTIKFGADIEKVVLDKSYAGMNVLGSNIELEKSFFLRPRFTRIRNRHIYFFPHATAPNTKNLFIIPVVGFNSSTPLQVGVLICNKVFPQPKFTFVFMPLYSLNTQLLWAIKLNYSFYPKFMFKRVSIGLYSKALNVRQNYLLVNAGTYQELLGSYVELIYKTPLKSIYSGGLIIKQVSTSGMGIFKTKNNYFNAVFNELKFHNNFDFNLLKLEINIRGQVLPKYFLSNKLSFETKFNYSFGKSRNIKFRFFAGKLFDSKRRISFKHSLYYDFKGNTLFGFNHDGNNDYTYDDTYINRSGTIQTYINEGGVRNRIATFGYMPHILAANFSVDILKNGLLSIYFDIAKSNKIQEINFFTNNNQSYQNSILTSPPKANTTIASGISITIVPNYVEIYVPLFLKNGNGNIPLRDGFKYTTIMLNLTKLNPFDAARKAYD